MNQDVIHVYFMPGMAASPKIFENIQLPENQFKMHFLEWFIPEPDEALKDYALRMTKKIKHENIALIGVSFGGVLVQEMSKYLKLRRLIIISSVSSKHELPKRMKIARKLKAYAIAPTSLASHIDTFAKYAFGSNVKKRVELYKKYLSVNDKRYLDWALKNMVCWDQDKPIPGTIHIHGEKDMVFPCNHINDCIKLKGGTHIMIINKFKWFNEHLPSLILTGKAV
ncbi:alpha/beta hydrolase [Hanstruepera neustonica]|uniref:Alpha/beta hydrolase n=1 Tax=Hanstruepera neustonica TaxID=1445657 RepID=A0A2K1DWN6_9FLAO|nr:alpha/beta hydrolase [Hanstruepera neustonica]PNQ72440.1 alpha/beta hydrolase [Hanstruepera neustonica]